MTKAAFEKIKAGLEDAISFANGDPTTSVVHIPAEIDVRAIRESLNLTQVEFAAKYGFGISRLRDWEQGRSQPVDAMRAYLKVIRHEAAAVDRALKAA